MDITQTFYNNLAAQYDKLFSDWDKTTLEQAKILGKVFQDNGFNKSATVLDCACGIGTQAIGLALDGYNLTASDISEEELKQAKLRASDRKANITFSKADFCALDKTFSNKFDIIIGMDNALPHMLSFDALKRAVLSIYNQINDGGIFVASIRDYDEILKTKPPYSPPYIHKTKDGQRVCFQTWEWKGENYKLIQYIIEDGKALSADKFECEYRAITGKELTDLFLECGAKGVEWLFPDKTGFYQPIIVVKK